MSAVSLFTRARWPARTTVGRLALLATLAVAWANFLLTARWAGVPGSLHGWRAPYYVAALGLATLAAVATRPRARSLTPGWSSTIALAAAAGVLAAVFFSWFPFPVWTLTPFLDNWTPRYESTLEGVALLRHGAAAGWQWAFLGGYPTASDISQSLTLLGALPMLLAGPAIGFHLLQALLLAAIPTLVYVDLRLDGPASRARIAAAFTLLIAGSYSYMLIRSGDVNSLAGTACAAAALVGSHAARARRRWGWPLLVAGLALTAWSHVGFLIYAVILIGLDAVGARDWRTAARGGAATAIALLASLPLTWELLRFPGYFVFNNVSYDATTPVALTDVARKLYYNTQLLWLPGRWANDYGGLLNVLLPVLLFLAVTGRGRTAFHARAALAVAAMLRLNVPELFGYTFARPISLLPVFLGPVAAALVLDLSGTLALALPLAAWLALFPQTMSPDVPHVRSISDFNTTLVDRVRRAPGFLVLVENSPHRDMDTSPDSTIARTPFGVHFESLMPPATGRLLYAGSWDGWQWVPWRGRVLAGGTWYGQAIGRADPTRFEQEMRRWGVAALFVWSDASRNFLGRLPSMTATWTDDRWTEYRFTGADPRSVTAPHGSAALAAASPLGGLVRLENVRAGDRIVVRTSYFPAWTARMGSIPVPLLDADGQLAFDAPADGSYDVTLVYPARRGLTMFALALLLATALVPLVAPGRAAAAPWRRQTAVR